MKKLAYFISPILTIIAVWYLLYFIIDEPLLVPTFTDVLKSFVHIFSPSYMTIVLMSVLRLIISFVISAILGISLGFISAKYHLFEGFNRPFITILRVIPVLSIIVILFIIIGSTLSPYVITFLILFPLFYQATLDGTKQIDPALLDVLKLNEMHVKESLKYVYIPSLSDALFVTVFQSLGLGIKVLVMAEYLMQVNHSIGKAIYMARIELNYSMVYAWTLLLILLAVTLESIALLIKKRQA